ncbi:hypothetical protein AKJ16_DCAP00399 [Drosera capensis]
MAKCLAYWVRSAFYVMSIGLDGEFVIVETEGYVNGFVETVPWDHFLASIKPGLLNKSNVKLIFLVEDKHESFMTCYYYTVINLTLRRGVLKISSTSKGGFRSIDQAFLSMKANHRFKHPFGLQDFDSDKSFVPGSVMAVLVTDDEELVDLPFHE